MARYQLILAYDGTDFEGFQRQGSSRTVQLVVEDALRSLGWQGATLLAAGRTDSGVHAAGQVIAFEMDWAHSPETLAKALNAHLPRDCSVQAARLAADDFHPRYSALDRTYHYRLFAAAQRHPLRERYQWRVWPEPDLDLLQAAAGLLIGTRDFVALGTPPKAGGSTIRQVTRAEWQPLDGGYRFIVTANAFLYHMVRRMVYLQTAVGQGRLGLQALQNGLEAGAVPLAGLAAPQGLALVEVRYP